MPPMPELCADRACVPMHKYQMSGPAHFILDNGAAQTRL